MEGRITIEIVVKSVLERLPVKVAEIIVPVINPVDTVGESKTVKEHYEKKGNLDREKLGRKPIKKCKAINNKNKPVKKCNAKNNMSKPIKEVTDTLPVKGNWVEVKYDGEGYCMGIVKKVLTRSTAKVYFEVDNSTQIVHWNSVKWKWH